VGLSQLQALLGFVTLNPTYIFAVLSRNAKPNNSRAGHRARQIEVGTVADPYDGIKL
ncbi:hypothetical protein D1AOALGA4SA_6004, partial [Olavius algarvensis Delta 1 endosymbiont]